MNENIKSLIRAVADNNMSRAQSYARVICTSNKSVANAVFCEQTIAKLSAVAQTQKMQALPQNVANVLYAEPFGTFRRSRYLLTDRNSAVVDSIANLYKVSDVLAEKGVGCLNSALFIGKSGVGKTELGRYIADVLELPYAYVNLSSVVGSYLGTTSKHIGDIFEYVSSCPSVLMLDELDGYAQSRASDSDSGTLKELNRVTLALIQQMDRLPSHCILLAATNREDLIDDAILRRFRIIHEVLPLSQAEARLLANRYIQSIGLENEVACRDGGIFDASAYDSIKPSDVVAAITDEIVAWALTQK